MNRLILTLALCLATLAPARPAGVLILAGAGSAPSGCSQATAFLARTSGLSGTETTAYTNMICGMVTDGTWGLFDALYIFATNTTTTANLNLISTSFGITTVGGTPTFSADQGYTTAGANALNTNFIPSSSGTNYTLNSSSLGVYILTNDTLSNSRVDMGGSDGTNQADFASNFAHVAFANVNDASNGTQPATTTSQGFWAATRTAASGAGAKNIYQNSSATSIGASSTASSSLPAFSMYIGARNVSGSQSFNSSRQYSAAFIAAGLTGAQFVLVSNRINAYMTALGINVF